jgi:transposase
MRKRSAKPCSARRACPERLPWQAVEGRFVPVKTAEQQGILMTHRSRALLVRQRTMLANALRAHLAELGFVANPGIANLTRLAEQALADHGALPSCARGPGVACPPDHDGQPRDRGARSASPRLACRE